MQCLQADLEQGPAPYKRVGYSLWASRIASDPDDEPFLFRKFDDLAALNLLYLQSELLDVESELKELDMEDARDIRVDKRSQPPLKDWDVLVKQAVAADEESASHDHSSTKEIRARSKRRMKLVKSIRLHIKEYHEALLLQSQVAQLQKPSRRVLQATRIMFRENNYPVIRGKAKEYLEADDLVALKSSTHGPISNYLRTSKLTRIKSTNPSNSSQEAIHRFNEQTVTRLLTVIIILLSAMFLVGPVLALYLTKEPSSKLAIALVFTAGFAGCFTLITGARHADIFVGTATYAAVMVVFISGDLSGSGQGGLNN